MYDCVFAKSSSVSRYLSAWRCGQAVQGELGMMGEQSQISDSAFSVAADSSLKAYTVIRSL